MIADISINEQWIALPAGLAGLVLCLYALWPTKPAQRLALGGGIICFALAIAFLWFGDAPGRVIPSPVRPDPVVVVPVTPVAGGLAELVPAEVRGKIGRYYLSLAEVITDAVNLKTTEDLRNAYVSACLLMKKACDLPEGLAGFRDATDKMFRASVGVETQQLTPAVRDKFTATCRTIAAELGVTQ